MPAFSFWKLNRAFVFVWSWISGSTDIHTWNSSAAPSESQKETHMFQLRSFSHTQRTVGVIPSQCLSHFVFMPKIKNNRWRRSGNTKHPVNIPDKLVWAQSAERKRVLPRRCCAAICWCFRSSWRWWCRRPAWCPWLLCSRRWWWCGTAPGPLCPYTHTHTFYL